jgi:hypothetical protein
MKYSALTCVHGFRFVLRWLIARSSAHRTVPEDVPHWVCRTLPFHPFRNG